MKIKTYYIMIMLYWFSAYAFVPTMTPYLSDIGLSYSMIGLVGSAYGLTQVILRLPLGIASDRLRRRRIFISIGLFLGMISSAGFFFTENEVLILLLRGLSGMGAATWVIMTVLFSSYFTREKAAASTSRLNMVNYFGQVAAMLSGAALAGYAGYKAPFLLSAVFAAAAFVMSFFVDEKAPPETKTPPSLKEMLQVGKNHRLLTMAVLATLVQTIFFGATITFLVEVARNLGITIGMLGFFSSVATIPRMIAGLVCGIILSKAVNERWLFAGMLLLTSVAMILTPFMPNLLLLFIVTLFGGFGIGMVFTMTLSLCTSEVDDSLKTTGMGFFQAIYGLGITAGPAIIGIVADHFSLTAGYLFAAGVALVGILVSLIFLEKSKAPARTG